MKKYHPFESIDCPDLQYVRNGNCWVCLAICCELSDPEDCMRCKFEKQRKQEERIRKEMKRGRIL